MVSPTPRIFIPSASFSTVNIATPSPIFIPFLFLLRGIVFLSDKTSKEVNPNKGTLDNISVPATITASERLLFIRCSAIENDLIPDVQAVETPAA